MIDRLPIFLRVTVGVLLLFVFVNTALAGVFIPQVFNNQADTTPPAKVVVTNLPLYKGAPSYSFIGENGLVWWIYIGFAPQECVPHGGVTGNLFWNRVMLTNLEGDTCFDVTNLVLGDYVAECSSDGRPSAFAYNAETASLTFYGPGDFRVCHIPLRLTGPIGQNNKELASFSETDLRPMTTDLNEVDWDWPAWTLENHHIIEDGDTFEMHLEPYP